MFSNGTRLGLMSKKKKRKTKRHRNCFCAASLCFVLLWMRKKIDCLLLNSRISGKYYANKRKMITDP